VEFEVNEDIYQRIEFYNKLQEAESAEEFMSILKDMKENHNNLYETYQFYRFLPEEPEEKTDTFMFGNIEDALEYVENILFCDVRRQYHGYKRTMKYYSDNELGEDILRFSFMNVDILPGLRQQIFGIADRNELLGIDH
jgi:hypothetical protein